MADAGKSWQYSRLGSLFGSIDAIIGLITGAVSGALVAAAPEIVPAIQPVLLAMAGLMVALIGVSVATSSVLMTNDVDPYLALIERTPGGLDALTRPYIRVAWTASIAMLLGLLVGLAWPIVDDLGSAALWLATGVPVAAGVWAVVGTAQLIVLHMFHLKGRAQLARTVRAVKTRHRSAS